MVASIAFSPLLYINVLKSLVTREIPQINTTLFGRTYNRKLTNYGDIYNRYINNFCDIYLILDID